MKHQYLKKLSLLCLFILLFATHLAPLQGIVPTLQNSNLFFWKSEVEEVAFQGTDKVIISKIYEKEYTTRKATVTAYNTVPQQTDNSPCISSDGTNICGRNDVVACPSDIPFGTRVAINGRYYYCHDRTARKYNGRFDISFDKDIRGAIEFGKRELIVKIYE